jgi:flagellar motor protein MotB
MFRRRQIPKKSGEGENPFLLTFSDFMASLLAIFILVLIVTLIELEKKKDDLRRQEIEIAAAKESLKKKENEISVAKDDLLKSLESIKTVQDSIANSLKGVSYRERALAGMLEGIQKELKQSGIEVVLAENGTVLRIPEQQLQFALGKYEIPLAHTGPANTIGRALLEALSKPENQTLLDTVFVEGHTDSVPNSREMGNWGLSTYRAISLWSFWTDKPGELSALKALRTAPADPKIAAKPLISVSGYADTRSTHGLLDGQALKDDRSEDRRIDIRFTLVSSEKQSLEGLRENMKQMRDKTDVLIKKLKSSSHDP